MTKAANLASLGSNASTTGILPIAGGGTAGTNGAIGFKNKIINGAMMIDQRNAGAAITTTGFVVDRFNSLEGTAGYTTLSVSSQQSTDTPSNFTNSIKVTVNTGQALTASRYLLAADHRIEGFNFASLGFGTAAAQSFTLSFWVKASVTGTYPVSFFNSVVSRAYLGTYTVNSANTWEQKSITVAGDTSGTWNTTNGIGLGMQFAISAGSDSFGTAGAWSGTYKRGVSGMVDVASTTGATFYITGVQLEVGTAATNFDFRAYGTELALCQRYAQVFGRDNSYQGVGCTGIAANSTTISYYAIPLRTQMRTAPSISYSGNWRLDDTYTASYAVNNMSANSISNNTMQASLDISVTSGLTPGRAYQLQTNNDTSARLILSAEL